MDFYYEALNQTGKGVFKKILRAAEHGMLSVPLPGVFHIEAVEKALEALSFDHPELFYIDFSQVLFTRTAAGMRVDLGALMPPGKRDASVRRLAQITAESLRQMHLSGGESAEQIYLRVHNRLVHTVTYDESAASDPKKKPNAFTAYGALAEGKAVCEGIAKAFRLLCACAGAADVMLIQGTSACEGRGQMTAHAWNAVRTGDGWAHIDVTWDLNLSAECGRNRYDYHMIPDEWIRTDHHFRAEQECRCADESFFVQNSCLIRSTAELKAYLNNALERGEEHLYFRLYDPNGLPPGIEGLVEGHVCNALQQHVRGDYSAVLWKNPGQDVWCYDLQFSRRKPANLIRDF